MADTDRHEPQIYQLRLVLRGISPLIWRRLLVRSDSTVAQLHERAAQVVAAGPVRNMAVGIDQVGEITDHIGDQIMPPALLQAQHREVRIPVVDLAKTAARN